MTPEAQRFAIAEACGLNTEREQVGGVFCYRDKEGHMIAALPNYLRDLNAMHEAAIALSTEFYKDKDGFAMTERAQFNIHLEVIVFGAMGQRPEWYFECLNATAPQRAEAFLKAKGLWKE